MQVQVSSLLLSLCRGRGRCGQWCHRAGAAMLSLSSCRHRHRCRCCHHAGAGARAGAGAGNGAVGISVVIVVQGQGQVQAACVDTLPLWPCHPCWLLSCGHGCIVDSAAGSSGWLWQWLHVDSKQKKKHTLIVLYIEN